MKNLKDVLEKLKVDDIVLTEEFPIHGTMQDAINFLKFKGFTEIKHHDVRHYFEYIEDFNKAGKKCFMVQTNGFGGNIIWFGDTRRNNISDDNRLYMITFYAQHNEFEYYENINKSSEHIRTNDFEKELKEFFK